MVVIASRRPCSLISLKRSMGSSSRRPICPLSTLRRICSQRRGAGPARFRRRRLRRRRLRGRGGAGRSELRRRAPILNRRWLCRRGRRNLSKDRGPAPSAAKSPRVARSAAAEAPAALVAAPFAAAIRAASRPGAGRARIGASRPGAPPGRTRGRASECGGRRSGRRSGRRGSGRIGRVQRHGRRRRSETSSLTLFAAARGRLLACRERIIVALFTIRRIRPHGWRRCSSCVTDSPSSRSSESLRFHAVSTATACRGAAGACRGNASVSSSSAS
ncbi:hypothetical protein M885DRAFT_525286 [Pelagophyceae sp. CCMP2097]|nr:hypothetical protein M885DRAFT_525286 [Pelagophyceae sp. CCMP2097]